MQNLATITAAVSVFLASLATADIVRLKDGSMVEGQVVRESDAGVLFDGKFSGLRATLEIPAGSIESIERRPLPDGFFDPAPPPARASDPASFDLDDTLYLEIPIAGRFGEQVFAEGIARALAYARRNAVGHVVFVIDSPGGDIDEAGRAYQALGRVHDDIRLHAYVRECRGAALGVALRCDSIFMAPGASIGGSDELLFTEEGDASELERRVVQSQLASQIAQETTSTPEGADVVRAMLDPREQLVLWIDEYDEFNTARTLPEGVAPDRVLLSVGENELLVLDDNTAARLGLPTVPGGVRMLGDELALEDWTPESDIGRQAMDAARIANERRAASAQTRFENQVRQNVERRERTAQAIETNIDLAIEWDPAGGEYASYGSVVRSKRGYLRVGSGGSRTWTKQSQRDWRYRTDAALGYLNKALRATGSMQSLDREAERLGLDPTYPDGELEKISREIRRHMDFLSRNRNRKQD